MSASQLVQRLHPVFNQDGSPERAFRVDCEDGTLAWAINDGVLTLTPAGSVLANPVQISLDGRSVSEVLALIDIEPGYLLSDINSAITPLGARMLVPGSGDTTDSNGNLILHYSSPLWHYLDAVASELDPAAAQLSQALAQMSLKTASGDWLDHWGSYFGVPRNSGEADAAYAVRIVVEVIRPRVNAVALENLINEIIAPYTVSIYEPHTDLFKLSHSNCQLSGRGRLYDGVYYAYATLDAITDGAYATVSALVARNKALGVRSWQRALTGSRGDPLDTETESQTVHEVTSIGVVGDPSSVVILDVSPHALSGPLYFAPLHEVTQLKRLNTPLSAITLPGGQEVDYAYDIDGNFYLVGNPLTPMPTDRDYYHITPRGDPADETVDLLASQDWKVADLDDKGYLASDTQVGLTLLTYGGSAELGFDHTLEPA